MKRANLSDAKQALFLQRIQGGAATPGGPAVVPVPRDGELPLSFGQQRLWAGQQRVPDCPLYNAAVAWRLSGPLDTKVLARALSTMIARHESLRTTFGMGQGGPVQVVSPPSPLHLEVSDLTGEPPERRESEARRLVAHEARQPFHLARGPLLRVRVLRLAAEEHVLIWVFHHTVVDGWSVGVLKRELSALYAAGLRGEDAALPPPRVQYADFAAWQRRWLRGGVEEGQLDYWRAQLGGGPAALELPTDHPRPAAPSYRGATVDIRVPAELTAGLRALARAHRATVFMTVLTAFQALLARCAGADDIAVGSPVAGRNRVETQEMVGLFLNLLVLRTDLSGDPSFPELLARVREVVLGAYAHQDVPFERLVEELQPTRDPGRHPLFQVMLYPSIAGADLELDGLAVTSLPVDNGTSHFDLTLSINDGSPSLQGTLEYSRDLFEEATVVRMAGDLEGLLRQVVARPGARLSELWSLVEAGGDHRWAETTVAEASPPASNGRVDGAGLRIREQRVDPGTGYVAPRTPAEEVLAAIWREALGLDRVGVEDNFFELGGDSILGIQVVSRAAQAGLRLSPSQLFEQQTVAGLASVAEAGPAEEAAEVAAFSLSGLDGAALQRLCAGREIDDVYPLSAMQAGMVFHSLYAPEAGEYVQQFRFRLGPEVELEPLQRAWSLVANHHPVLRSSVEWQGLDRPLQVVHRRVEMPVEHHRWERDVELRAILEKDRRRGLELGWAPLMRLTLLEGPDGERELLWTVHHLLLDGWSLPLVLEEVRSSHRALLRGEPPRLPERRPYRDYIAWLAGQDTAASEAWWREALSDLEAPTLLAERVAPGRAGERHPQSEELRLSERLTGRLRGLARRHRLTLSTVVQGAWGVLLSRYTGGEDVVFGATVSGRPAGLPGVEAMVGLFINTVPVRLRVDPEVPVAAWLGQLQAEQVDLRQHEHTPLVEVQGWSPLPPGTPLFDTLLVVENVPELTSAWGRGDALELLPVRGDTNYPLTLVVTPGPCLSITLEYDAQRFGREAVQRLGMHLERLLEGMAADPGTRLGELELLGEDERHRLLVEWNATAEELPTRQILTDLFEEQVARTPEATAVVAGERSLTYAELAERARRLAHHLGERGVGPDVRVGICVERGLEMVVGLLGILEAGGAYVPLDPGYPAERLAFMLQDTAAPVVLTRSSLRERLPATGAQVVCLDADAEAIAAHPACPPESGAGPESLAYVIYTSGSTGTPKGVMVSHGNVTRLIRSTEAWFGFGPDDTWALFHSYAFDFSVWEMWGALAYGGRLVVVPHLTARNARAFRELLSRERVTVLNQTPSAFGPLMDADEEAGSPLCLRTVIFGGEALEPQTLRRWIERHGDSMPRLINMYGITETTVHVTYRPITVTDLGARSPIGRRIPDLTLYILDPRGRPVPVGVAGELHVGGAGLARGYLNRPELTAERFIPNPFSSEPGARLYRTGDLARYREDGDVEYLGRIDQQVKIRGYRIELGEIEAVLGDHPAVRQAVVTAREDVPGQRRLVAYVVPSGEWPGVGELRAHLASRLPEHMMPSAFVALQEVPLTPNGKVHRRALPSPDTGRLEVEAAYVAPRTPVEETLARIWSEVLGRERVGVEDNFFELGGDSILSIQIVSRAARAGLRLSPRQLFEQQTVARLAAVADAGPPVAAVAAEQGTVVGEVPLTPIQRWFLEQELPERHHFNQSAWVELPGEVDGEALEGALAFVVSHHDALRMRLERGASGWRQHIVAGEEAELLRWVELSEVEPAQRQRVMEEHAARAQGSLDLAAGPALRALLFRGAAREPSPLLMVVHHLAVDGVSWQILLEDLLTAYQQLRAGGEVRLPAKTTSFQEWARRLEEHAGSGAVLEEAGHWMDPRREKVSRLPVDHAGGSSTASSAASVWVSLGPEETRRLLQQVPPAYRTQINDVLLTALAEALTRWMGAGPVLVDLEGHGREELFEEVDLSRTVGWFTSLFPVLLEVEGSGDLARSLRSVKEQLRAVPRKGIGYGVLRYLSPDGGLSARLASLPGAEVSFNYLGQFSSRSGWMPLGRPGLPAGLDRSAAGRRPHLVEITGAVVDGELRVSWTYSREVHDEATVSGVAETFVEVLRGLIAHCSLPGAGGLTPSDVPLSGLDGPALERLCAGRQIDDVYPLSPMQSGMVFHSLYTPEGGEYVEQFHFRLGREADVELLGRAWSVVANRHPVLRSSVEWQGLDRPLQVVHRRVEVPVEHESCETDLEVQAFLNEDRRRGLELSRAPLMRLTVLEGPDGERELLWTVHHLLLDGWSLPLVLDELRTSYVALLRGEQPRLPERRPYRDYIAWLAEQDTAASQAWWRKALQGLEAPTLLVAPGQVGPGTPQREDLRLSEVATARLQRLARRHRLTLSTVVQGAWGVLLSRYTGGEDVVFGATVSGRPAELPGVEAMVGLLINTVPVRLRVDPEVPVAAWLGQLQAEQVDLRQHEHTPLVEVQGWSPLPPGTPLFDTLLVVENYPVTERAWERGENLELLDAVEQTNYPLTLVVVPGPCLSIRLLYDARRFGREAVQRLGMRLERLLEGMAADAETPLGELELLGEDERHRLLVEWNATAAELPAAATIARLFEEQAARTPEATAAVAGERSLTYAELEERANRLGHHLRERGVGPEVLVGICVERGLELVVGLLGILKAGGAYVPLDPGYPAERLAFMLEDTAAPVVVTQSSLRGRLPETEAEMVCLDADAEAIGAHPASPLQGVAGPESLAYVIYTSGSTGTPKGICIPQVAVIRLVVNTDYVVLRPDDVVAQASNASFDATTFEVWGALLSGACLTVIPTEVLLSPPLLGAELRRRGVTTMWVTVGVFNQVAAQAPEVFGSLRHLLTGGDAVDAAAVRRVLQRGRPERLLNGYGPTETTTFATTHLIEEVAADATTVPIGRPIANTEVYLLDGRLRPVPVGVPGELCIGGPGLARGYLNRPELTAERFVPHPFSSEAGARLFRTGDLARYREDGSIEFLGRLDQQVKIRGYRIECGEVEAALTRHPGVCEAVVVARGDASAGRRLVAYVVPAAGQETPGVGELRAHLAGRLPEYMVPSAFVALERLPLTPNGKVDRRALPPPHLGRLEAEAAYVAPRTSVEERLARIWSEVLGLERVGAEDDFFELGGHSLLAMRLVAVIEREFGVRLPLSLMFGEVTISRLATAVRCEQEAAAEWATLIPIRREGTRPPLFIAPGVSGDIFEHHRLVRYLDPAQPVYGLHAVGLDGRRCPHTTIEDMAAHHVSEILQVQAEGPHLLAGYCFGGEVAYEIAHQLREQGRTVALLALIDAEPPMVGVARLSVLARERAKLEDFFRADMRGKGAYIRRRANNARAKMWDRIWYAALDQCVRRGWRPPRWLQDVEKVNYRAIARYVPPVSPCRVTLFRAAGEVQEHAGSSSSAWRRLAAGGVEVRPVVSEGIDHLSMLREPHVRALAAALTAAIEKACVDAAVTAGPSR